MAFFLEVSEKEQELIQQISKQRGYETPREYLLALVQSDVASLSKNNADKNGAEISEDDIEIENIYLLELGDDDLWALVFKLFDSSLSQRLSQLNNQSHNELSPDNEKERYQLLKLQDEHLLLRSEAMLILQQRGYDVRSRLQNHSL